MTRSAVGVCGCGNACACVCAWTADAITQPKMKRPIMRIITSHLLPSTLVIAFAVSPLAATITDVHAAVKAGLRHCPVLPRALGELTPRGRLSQHQPSERASQQHTGKEMLDVVAGN